MTLDEFKNLKEGDTVTYNGKHDGVYKHLKAGDTLTRKSHWMDDNHSRMFTYGDDFHFFRFEDIKE